MEALERGGVQGSSAFLEGGKVNAGLGESGALLGSGEGMGLAEEAVFADEDDVYLGESVIEGTVEKAGDVVNDEAKFLHFGDDIVELRAAFIKAEETGLEDDDFGLLESGDGAGENLELGALHVHFDKEGAGEIAGGALLVNGDDGNAAGSAVNGGTFDFAEQAGTGFVGVDVDGGVAGAGTGGGEDVLGLVFGANEAKRSLELGERLDEQNGGAGELLVESLRVVGDADVNEGAGLKAEARELAKGFGEAGARGRLRANAAEV